MSSNQWISATVREMPRSSSCSMETGLGADIFLRVLSNAMERSANGLRVLVTAGGSGIGCVIAQTFAERGARVQVCDVDDKALAALAREIFRTRADVASVADVDRLFEEVRRNLGGLDVLVNNAGIAGPTAPVEEIRPEDWDRCIAVDLNGMF